MTALAGCEGVGQRAVMPSFRDYAMLLEVGLQRSLAQLPTCSQGMFPKPQTLAGTVISTPLGPTPTD